MSIRISQTFNRFAKPWPKISYLPPEWDKYTMPDCDFYVYLGPDMELLLHPDTIVDYGERDVIGAFVTDASIHSKHPTCPAELGFPLFHNDFFVVKNCSEGNQFLEKWKELQDVSLAVYESQVKPVEYQGGILLQHCPVDFQPVIVRYANV